MPNIRGMTKSKILFEIKKCEVMCENCHRKFHNIYGKENNNKKQLEEFLNESIS